MRGATAERRMAQLYDAWTKEHNALCEIKALAQTPQGTRTIEAAMLEDYLRVVPEAASLYQERRVSRPTNRVFGRMPDGQPVMELLIVPAHRVMLCMGDVRHATGAPLTQLALWSYDPKKLTCILGALPTGKALWFQVKARGRVIMLYGERGLCPAKFIYYGQHNNKSVCINRPYRFWERTWVAEDRTAHWSRDIFFIIMHYVGPTDTLRFRLVSKRWRRYAEAKAYWGPLMNRIRSTFGSVASWAHLPDYVQFARYSLHGITGPHWTDPNHVSQFRANRVHRVFCQSDKGYEPMLTMLGCAVAQQYNSMITRNPGGVFGYPHVSFSTIRTKGAHKKAHVIRPLCCRPCSSRGGVVRECHPDMFIGSRRTLNDRRHVNIALVWVNATSGQLFVTQPGTKRGYSTHRNASLIQTAMYHYMDRFARGDTALYVPPLSISAPIVPLLPPPVIQPPPLLPPPPLRDLNRPGEAQEESQEDAQDQEEDDHRPTLKRARVRE